MHLLLTEENLRSYETSFKLSPPLRTELDRKHLIDALRAGVIDCIASDHSPQSEEDKDVEFESAAPGASSLEITWGATYELVKKGELQLSRAIEALTFGPSKVMGFKDRGQLKAGLRGDFTVFQVGSSWKVNGEDFYSKSKYTPFEGCTFNSQVTSTFVGGHQVYDKEIGVLR
jgi:dihydroorotase